MQFNTKDRELTLKIVYYGPGLSGKTTNLQALYQLLHPEDRSHLMTLDTKGDRTLFFDLLPFHFATRSGFKVKLKVFTVPGQVMHEATRRLVLSGTDAVCFIADSQRTEHATNNEAFQGMLKNLRSNGLDPDTMPIVIQFNKCDLPDAHTSEELMEMGKLGKEPVFRASAVKGEGVLETFSGCLGLLWDKLSVECEFEERLGVTREEFMSGVLNVMHKPERTEAQP